MSPLIALLTDFGLKDPYAGIMKGVLLERCPGARVVDLSHGVAPQDVRGGAFCLMSAVPYFPAGSIFVCVVDPGVGSKRRILWAKSERHQFLAPDNGILSWAERVHPLKELRAVTNRRLFLPQAGATFHGRDIFAPVAAALAWGEPAALLGPQVRAAKRIRFPAPRASARSVRGEVLVLDRFGNAVTNLRPSDLRAGMRLALKDAKMPLRGHYAEVPGGKPLALAGSSGFIELSVNGGNFALEYSVRVGDPVYAR